jgi:hypothetical protein
MVCRGAEGGEEASGVPVVTRYLAIAMLAVAGVAPALVGVRIEGEGRGRRQACAACGLGPRLHVGLARAGQGKKKGRERAAGPPVVLIGPREEVKEIFSFSIF